MPDRRRRRRLQRTLLSVAMLSLVATAMNLPMNATSQVTTGTVAVSIEISGVLGETPVTGLYGLALTTNVIETFDGATGRYVNDPGPTRFDPFTFERPFSLVQDGVGQWYENLRNGIVDKRSISLIFRDGPGGTEVGRLNVFEAWPCGFALGPVVSAGGGVPSEFITICYDLMQYA